MSERDAFTDSTVNYSRDDRYIWIHGIDSHRIDWYVKVEFNNPFWFVVELDQFGGFKRRLWSNRD